MNYKRNIFGYFKRLQRYFNVFIDFEGIKGYNNSKGATMFNIGDKVVYPMHGAGRIESIEKKEILGEFHSYFVLRLCIKSLKIMIPVDNVESLGLRYVVEEEELEEMFEILSGKKTRMAESWNKRYRENLDKLKTGDVVEIAIVVRNLELRDREKSLSTGEKKMLANAKQYLASEVALIREISENEGVELIENSITSV